MVLTWYSSGMVRTARSRPGPGPFPTGINSIQQHRRTSEYVRPVHAERRGAWSAFLARYGVPELSDLKNICPLLAGVELGAGTGI